MGKRAAPSVSGGQRSTKPPLLEIRNISKSFGGLRALSHCGFSVDEGDIVGLIGPNGSGKTTLFNIIAGYLPQDEGAVLFRGHDLAGLRPYQIARKGLGRTFQVTRIFPKMTLLENLLLHASPGDRLARAKELLQIVDLFSLREEYASDLSFGQQRLLSIVQVLMLNPTLILLDEPAAGVNPVMQRTIVALMHRLNAEGKTFLVIEHNMDLVMNNCRRIVVLHMGQKIADDTPAAVRANDAVLAAYFGA